MFRPAALCLGLLCSFYSAARANPQKPDSPNIVFILADDLGWTDLGCMGSKLCETPHIDQLARQGMTFTDAYAACTVCSPTRAAIMTGKYPARLHLTDWIAGYQPQDRKFLPPKWTMQLRLEEITLAETLKAAGYNTASIGKWHLGDEPYYPEHQGFDLNVAGDHWGQPGDYFWPYQRVRRGKRIGRMTSLPGGRSGEYLTDRLTDEAIRFIETNRDRPFFLYLPHYAVHMPLQAKKELVEYYRTKLERGDQPHGQQCAVYAAMIHSLDQGVGRIMDELQRLKIDDRTIVVFTSDNGGLILPLCNGRPITSNAPLRAGKGSAYEGGVRVPLFVRWPGVAQPGSTCAVPVASIDFYPTFLGMLGLPEPDGHASDGESLVPLLEKTGPLRRDALYWHYPHYHPGGATPHSAIRQGDFRLVEFYEDGRVELYDLRDDVGEKQDLSKEKPELAERLRQRLHAWRKNVDAQTPIPNPKYLPISEQNGTL